MSADSVSRRRLVQLVLIICAAKLFIYLLILPSFAHGLTKLWGIGPVDNYDEIARNIWLGHGYRYEADTSLTLMREPGYPYFLAALMRLMGDDPRPAIVANVLFTSISALLVSSLSRSISSRPAVWLLTPLLFLLHPGIMIAELRMGVEAPLILLLLWMFVAMRRALHSGAVADFAKVGLTLGLTCYVRSTALLFPVCLLVGALLTCRSWSALMRATLNAVTVIATALLVLTPWIVRNYNLAGQFVPTASVTGVAMQAGNYICVHADGKRSFHDLDNDAARARNAIAHQEGYDFKPGYYQLFYDPHDEVAFTASLRRLVLDEYAHSPRTFLKCTSENVFNFWFTGRTWAATLVNVCVQLPYLLLALYGLLLGYRTADRIMLVQLLLFVAYTWAVYALIHAQARYSMPVVPILAMLAAIPIALWVSRSNDPENTDGPVPDRRT